MVIQLSRKEVHDQSQTQLTRIHVVDELVELQLMEQLVLANLPVASKARRIHQYIHFKAVVLDLYCLAQVALKTRRVLAAADVELKQLDASIQRCDLIIFVILKLFDKRLRQVQLQVL